MANSVRGQRKWEFPKIRLPYFGVLVIRILLFRVLYQGPLVSETPKLIFAAQGSPACGLHAARTGTRGNDHLGVLAGEPSMYGCSCIGTTWLPGCWPSNAKSLRADHHNWPSLKKRTSTDKEQAAVLNKLATLSSHNVTSGMGSHTRYTRYYTV